MANDKQNVPPERQEEMDADISPEEIEMLNSLDTEPNSDDADRVLLDNTDEDGTRLNESSSGESGRGLDVPGSELDNDNEDIGEEDEENNSYSQADTE